MSITIPYNPNLKDYAQENRQTETMSEKIFWNIVRNNKLNGLKFYRQKIVGEYIVDFICSDTGVVIEIDGDSHNEKLIYDKKRDNYMQGLELEIIRVKDRDVIDKTDELVNRLSKHPLLQGQMSERRCVFVPFSRNSCPPPTPSKGGGNYERSKIC